MGKSVCGGIAIGRLAVCQKEDKQIKRTEIENTTAEVERFLAAKEIAKEQLADLYEKALQEIGEENAMIFEVHRMMLEDSDYVKTVIDMIESQHVSGEFAVANAGEVFAGRFAAMEDEYLRERGADVKDISNRVIAVLQGKDCKELTGEEPAIVLAEDLTPSETVQMDKSKVLSFVTRYGSTNSHTAILARTMNIPALVDVEISGEMDGQMGIVDGYEGKLIVVPEDTVLEEYRAKQRADEERNILLQELKGKETITMDGKKIGLSANIGCVEDAEAALSNDAEGIGLFRTEFLYLEASKAPDEEVQFAAYKAVAERMEGRRLVIRTLDIGADKQADYLAIEREENPAMGYRGIRICLDRPELFKTQLRAIYRASVYGQIALMFPMIINLEEIRQIKELIEAVKQELSREGIPYQDCELGIVIETPAAALISDLLAEEVDFFSVGTNDLTQYALAVDRQNSKLDSIYDTYHEAILRMMRLVVDNGHKGGCRVGICGEAAGDTNMTETFLRMGFDELSVSPSMILKVREAIRSINLK